MKSFRIHDSNSHSIGNQPVRYLQPFILSGFENVSPLFFNTIKEQIRYHGLNQAIEYNVKPVTAETPHIEGLNGTIHLRETFLSYIWGITYAILVLYDEMIVFPKTSKSSKKSPSQRNLVDDALEVFHYAISLTKKFTVWPIEDLPNPELYSDEESFYIQRADAVFIEASIFILMHEFAHFYLGHLEADVTSTAQEAERKSDEMAADKFALETILDKLIDTDVHDANTIRCGILVGMGSILLLHPTLDGGDEHPDPHIRLYSILEKLSLSPTDNLWGVASLFLVLWSTVNDKPPIGGHTYHSLQELLTLSMDQLHDPRYRF